MNTDLTNVHLWQTGPWTKLYDALTSRRFYFPVVYTDGLISRCKKYAKRREPFGLLVDGSIMILQKKYQKMDFSQAEEFCSQIVFSLKRASVASWAKMVLLNHFIEKVDATAQELGFERLFEKTCWTADGDKAHRIVRFGYAVQDYYAQSDENRFYVLPQIDLKKPSSMITACEA